MKLSEIIGVIIVIIALLVAFAYTSQGCVAGPAPGDNPPADNPSPPPADNPSPAPGNTPASPSPPAPSIGPSHGVNPGSPYGNVKSRLWWPDPCQMHINGKCINYLGKGFWMIDGKIYKETQ